MVGVGGVRWFGFYRLCKILMLKGVIDRGLLLKVDNGYNHYIMEQNRTI